MRVLQKYQSPFVFWLLGFITAFLTGCGGGSTPTATSPSISTTTVPNGTTGTAYTTSITATGGTAPYTWSVSSGTLPAGLALGTSTTNSVTISGTPNSAQQGASFTMQVKDSAAKTATKAFTMNITSTISVAITNKRAGIAPAAAAVEFDATVQNDTAHQGVTWTLKANGADCSPACGTLTGATDVLVIYTPPPTVPASPNNSATLTAISVADSTKSDSNLISITNSPLSACTSSGHEAALNGKYAFLLQGNNSTVSTHMVGSFTADGAGKITAGEVDVNGAVPSHANLDTTATTYSVGADNRGCMTLKAGSTTTVVHFALGQVTANVAAKGRLIQFDDAVGTGTRSTGLLLKQDTAAIATNLSGNYAFNLVGTNSLATRYAAAGAFTVSSTLLTDGEVDVDDAGTAAHATGTIGSLSSTLSGNGRGSFTLSATPLFPTNFAFYVVSNSEVLMASTDSISSTAPVVSGELRLQSGTFTNASLHGVSILHTAGLDSGTRSATIGTFTTDGAGNVSAAIYNQDGVTVNPVQNTTTTYTVAANGRTTLAASGSPVLYLTGSNTGLVAANDSGVASGEFEAQKGSPFSASSLSGTYFFGTDTVASNVANTEVGVATPDGAGNATLTLDLSSSTGLSIDINSSSTFTVNADGTAIIGGNPALLISPNKVLIIDGGSGNANANVVVLEK
jgi:hypothetical protein